MLMIDERVCPFSAFEFCQNSWWAHRRPANGCKPHPFGKANVLATRSYHQGRQGMAVDMLRFVVSAERMTGSAKSIKMHSTWIQMDPNGAFKDLYNVGSQWFEYYPAFGQTHDGYVMSMSCVFCCGCARVDTHLRMVRSLPWFDLWLHVAHCINAWWRAPCNFYKRCRAGGAMFEIRATVGW